jgi:hypothetical protein
VTIVVATDAASTRTLVEAMADKAPKAKAKASASEKGVLASLPSTRPERLGAPRRSAAKPAAARPRGAAAHTTKPRAVRNGSPDLKARRAVDPPAKPLGAPKGKELVSTAIRATGELAQFGLVVGGQVVKRTIKRLPRP